MSASLSLVDIIWRVTTAAEIALLATLFWRKANNSFPFFTAYLVSVFLQSVGMFYVYRQTQFSGGTLWDIAWGTQAGVTVMRSLALVELTRKILARYTGIWALARILILCVGICVIAYALAFSRGHSQWVILNLVRGLELAMAAVIVTVLLFARYYRLPIGSLSRAVAVGLCLYSVFYVIDYSLLEKGLLRHMEIWNFLSVLTFLASLLLWLVAFQLYPAREQAAAPAGISPEAYGVLSSEVNLRLYLLNRQIHQILSSGERRP